MRATPAYPPVFQSDAAWYDAGGRGGSKPNMSKGRLEAFSDGVIAIIITIMVLELHAPRFIAGGTATCDTDVLQLRTELRFRRDLLEQPPSSSPRRSKGEWRNTVGEPAPSFLAVAGAVRNRLDGSEPFRCGACGGLRRRAIAGGDSFYNSREDADRM
jgi:hypothetical protein